MITNKLTSVSKHTIVAFGEVLWDLLPDKKVLGGAVLNFTSRINALGNEGIIISRIGQDNLGLKALRAFEKLHLDDRNIQRDLKYPTGTVQVFFDEYKNPDYTIKEKVAYDYIESSPNLFPIIEKADCFCFGTLAQRNVVSRRTLFQLLNKFSGKFVFYDINMRKNCYTSEIIHASLIRANILKLNHEEAYELAKMFEMEATELVAIMSELMLKYNLKYCLITLADQGVLASDGLLEPIYVPAHKIEMVDPLGAGDAFSAGFIHSILNKSTLAEACKFGNLLGGLVVQQAGATQPISETDITEFPNSSGTQSINRVFKKYLIN